MAIVWGNPAGSSGHLVRIGIALTIPVPTAGQSSVTINTKVYVQTQVSVYDSSNTATITGNGVGSGYTGTLSFNIANNYGSWNDNNIVLLKEFNTSVATSYSDQAISVNFNFAGIDYVSPTTLNAYASGTLKARPLTAPPAPPSATKARVSDSKFTVTWTAPSTSSGNVVQGYKIVRFSKEYPKASTSGVVIATLSSSATSYDDTGVTTNNAYDYSVQSYNTAGSATTATSGSAIPTTQSAPTNVQVSKAVSDIVVTWDEACYAESGFRVYDYVNGSSTPTLLTTTAAGVKTWTYSGADPAKTHKLAVSSITSNSLESAIVASGTTLQLQAPPNPPSLISPVGTAFDATRTQAFRVQHNSADSTAITALEIQYRTSGSTGAYTTTGKQTSSDGSWTAAANRFAQNTDYEWQARTWGQHANPSDWSASSTFRTRIAPVANITAPTAGSGVNGDLVLVTWSYYSGSGAAQSSATLVLRDGSLVELERKTVTGTGTTAQFAYRVQNGASYYVDLSVVDANGVSNGLASVGFSVTYQAPEPADVDAVWDPATGAVTLTIANLVASGKPDPASNEVYRYTDGTWVLIAQAGLNTSIKDAIPPTTSDLAYQVRTRSTIGSTATTPVTVDATNTQEWYWLNSGPSFDVFARLRLGVGGPSVSVDYGRETSLVQFSGRAKPRVYSGAARKKVIKISAVLEEDDLLGNEDALIGVIDAGGTLCLRDPRGRRWFVNLPEASFSEGDGLTGIDATFTEVDYAE